MMPAEPHPAVAALLRQRIEHRNGTRDQTHMAEHRKQTMAIERAIFEAEREHGAGVFLYRRCQSCALLHSVKVRGCDGRGSTLLQLWVTWGVDLISVVE